LVLKSIVILKSTNIHDLNSVFSQNIVCLIDFLIYDNFENIIAIEAKSGPSPSKKDLKGFAPFEEEFKLQKKIVVCLANQPQINAEGVEILPIHIFLEKLWEGKIV
jgi:predicted AAA+ superfamily ATPase